MAQCAKDLVLLKLRCRSQLWLGFSPWPRNVHKLQVLPKTKTKTKTKTNKKKRKTKIHQQTKTAGTAAVIRDILLRLG